MIKGVGVDIIEVARVRDTVVQWGNRFLEKVFTEVEIQYCSAKANPYQHYAARFAAKEAVAKALALGWSGGFRWQDVEVVNDASGKPSVILYGHAKKQLGESRVFVSISHTTGMVIAFVVIESV